MVKRPESTLKRDLFRRRHKTIEKKAHHLAQTCGARVYVVVFFRGQYHTYTSHKNRAWPPSEEEIVRCPNVYNTFLLTSKQDQSYPLPQRVEPSDFM